MSFIHLHYTFVYKKSIKNKLVITNKLYLLIMYLLFLLVKNLESGHWV